MSLIEEALRKQEQEEGRRTQPAVPATPGPIVPSPHPVAAPAAPAPALAPTEPARAPVDKPRSPVAATPPSISASSGPLPVNRPGLSLSAMGQSAMHPDRGRQRSLTLMTCAGAGLLVLLLAAGMVCMWLARTTQPAGPVAATPVTVPMAASSPVVKAAPIATPWRPPETTPRPVHPAATTPAASRPGTASVVVAPSAAPAATAPAPVAPVAPAAVAAVTPVSSNAFIAPLPIAATPVVPPPPPNIAWPEIVVKGFATVSGRPLVLLGDGLTLESGTTAPNGVRLLEAGSGWFRLSYKGQSRIYRQSGRSYVAYTNEANAGSSRP